MYRLRQQLLVTTVWCVLALSSVVAARAWAQPQGDDPDLPPDDKQRVQLTYQNIPAMLQKLGLPAATRQFDDGIYFEIVARLTDGAPFRLHIIPYGGRDIRGLTLATLVGQKYVVHKYADCDASLADLRMALSQHITTINDVRQSAAAFTLVARERP